MKKGYMRPAGIVHVCDSPEGAVEAAGAVGADGGRTNSLKAGSDRHRADFENRMTVEFSADIKNQSLARAVAVAYVTGLDPVVEEVNEVRTAVSEAFSNAVLHGYKGDRSKRITMEMKTISKDTVMIRVSDKGIGIEDIARAMEPLFTTDESEECSGMGFTVMESFMDKIRVDSAPGQGTTVTMIKKFDTYSNM